MGNGVVETVSSVPAGDLRRRFWAVGALAVALGLAFLPVAPAAAHVWSRADYSHGFLVPLISLYLAWLERHRLATVPIRPAPAPGLAILASGCVLLAIGGAGSMVTLQLASFVVVIIGIVLALLGPSQLRTLGLPIGYLAFMVPFMDLFLAQLHPPFQHLAAAASSATLRLAGMPVYREGILLNLPHVVLEVADECSGVRFMVSLVAIGIPLAFLLQRRWWRRALFILFSLLTGLAANTLRITLIGLWTYYRGGPVHGPQDIFQVVFVTGAGYLMLFGAAFASAETAPRFPGGSLRRAAVPEVAVGGRLRTWLAALALLLATAAIPLIRPPRAVPLSVPLTVLPMTAGDWSGVDSASPLWGLPFEIVGADMVLDRTYRRQGGSNLRLLVAYYSHQRQGKELVFYQLQPLYNHVVPATLRGGAAAGREVSTARYYHPARRKYYGAVYWHQLGGRTLAGRYETKLAGALQVLASGTSNGAVGIILGETATRENVDLIVGEALELAAIMVPALEGATR